MARSPVNRAAPALALLLLVTATPTLDRAHAAERTSASYRLSPDTLDAGGGSARSPDYTHTGTLTSFGGASISTTPNFTARHGFIGQLQEVAGLQLSATPTHVNETETRAVDPRIVYDDGSSFPTDGSAVTWLVLDGPVAAISPDGLVTAGIVYQNSLATIRGTYQGFSAALTLGVFNVNRDDYGRYAADGLPDDWQAHYFGLESPFAAPSMDPDGDRQSNSFEYIAGLNPTNYLSRFELRLETVPHQPNHKRILFQPRLGTRTYHVEFRTDPAWGPFAPVPGGSTADLGELRAVIDTSATNSARFYRVRIQYQGN